MPNGLAKTHQRRLRLKPPKESFSKNKAKNSLEFNRKLLGREWRYFKRNRLWDRAKKAAKRRTKHQEPRNKKHRQRTLLQRAMNCVRIWFRNTISISERREEYKLHCHAVKMQQTSLQQSNQVQRKQAKQRKLKHFKQLKGGTLNVRGCNHLPKREMIDDILKQHQYDVLLLTETNLSIVGKMGQFGMFLQQWCWPQNSRKGGAT